MNMKYLKLYEALNLSHSKATGKEKKEMIIKELSKQINWKMIEDIKDMSLEYLDENLTLRLEIIYNKNYRIYSQLFSHNPDENWEMWYIVISRGDKCRCNSNDKPINYIRDDVEFIYDVSLWTSNYRRVKEEETNELVNRIKEAYPNEKIYSLYDEILKNI